MMNIDEIWGVILTGPEGMGKTTIGKELAKAWGWRCLDADDIAPILSGMSLDETMRLLFAKQDWTAEEILECRRVLLNHILVRKPRARLILPTTLRAVLLAQKPAPELVEALERHWIVLYLCKDIDDVCQYFLDHPEAKRLRQRLDKCDTKAELKDTLWKFQREMSPHYAKFCQGTVSLTGDLQQNLSRVASEAFRLVLPPEML